MIGALAVENETTGDQAAMGGSQVESVQDAVLSSKKKVHSVKL